MLSALFTTCFWELDLLTVETANNLQNFTRLFFRFHGSINVQLWHRESAKVMAVSFAKKSLNI